MSVKIGILSIASATNLFNVQKALEHCGADVYSITDLKDLKKVDKIVLPGVGSFYDMMIHIGDQKEALKSEMKNKAVLGICLGMQILGKMGFEYGEIEGLELIDGEVKKMEVKAKTPHMGWNRIIRLKDSVLLREIDEDEKFYFMHSYELVNYNSVIALTEYHKHQFVSVVEQDNIFGVQFHPEKSREVGLKLLNNFIKI